MTTQLRQKFEKDLKGKLLLKTSGHMTEEMTLFKDFKYFDTNNSGLFPVQKFIQAISKVGLYGYSDEELAKLFKEYSEGEDLLDYKDFIGIVFNNVSMRKKKEQVEEEPEQKQEVVNEKVEEKKQEPNKEEEAEKDNNEENDENENEELDPVEELLMQIRNKLAQRGLANLIGIETGFRELDTQNEQAINLETFKKACQQFNFELNEEQVKDLFVVFDREETGTVNYDEFIRVLRGELSQKRKELVDKVFKEICKGGDNIPLENLFNLYEPKGSIEMKKKKMSGDEALQVFVETFRDNHLYLHGEEEEDKPVDLEEFEDYYESVSLMIPDDEEFKNVLFKTWGLIKEEEPVKKEEPVQEIKKEEKEEIKEEPPKKEEEPVKEEIKEEPVKEEKKNISVEDKRDAYAIRKEKEREFRRNLLDEQNMDNFRNVLGSRGMKAVMNFYNQLKQYDRKGDKELPFSDFAEIVDNANLNMTENEIKDLFKDFAPEPKTTLNYAEFLSALTGDLNPRRKNVVLNAFKKLDVEKCEVINLSEIKTNFNSKNSPMVREGYMAEGDFYNNFMETFQTHHNLFRSAKIKKVNLDEFVDYYKFVSITIEDDYLFEEMIISSWKLTKSTIAHAGPKDNVKSLMKQPGGGEEEPVNPEEGGKKKTAKKYFPSKHGSCPYGVDNKATDYSNLLHPKGELVGIKLNKNDAPIELFRKKIIARGLRGIMSLKRTFIINDENKNGKLSPEEFHKFISDYRMPISPKDEEGIFKNFDKDKSGDIDYNELINAVVGKMNDYRRQIIEQVYEKLDKDKNGKVPFDVIRNNYNPNKHPEVLSGKRDSEEMLSRFIDLFEYHFNLLNQNKDTEVCSLEEFIQFYNVISMFIDDDKYFDNLISRVWELNNEINYAKGFRNLKRKNIF